MALICRLCLGESKSRHSLLEQQNFDMLESLTAIKVLPDDSSTIACTKCLDELTEAFNIQQRILQTNEKFKNEVIVVMKHEDVVEDRDEIEEQSSEAAPLELKTCPVCASSIEKSALLKHTKVHFECSQYCDLCKSTFATMKLYEEHWHHDHTNERTSFECTVCKLKFKYRSIFCVHMTEAHSPVDVDGNTQECEEPSIMKTQILKSPKKEVDHHNVDFVVQESQDMLEENADLNTIDPLYTDSSVEKPREMGSFECSVCQKQFKSKKRLSAHQAYHKPKRTCPICNVQTSFPNFNLHVRKHDPLDRIHFSNKFRQMCELCGASLGSPHALYSHKRIMHSEFGKKCEECGRLFTNPDSYQMHLKQHKEMSKSTKCAVVGCHQKELGGVSNFNFPDPKKSWDRFLNWVKATGNEKLSKRSSEEVRRSHRICSRHFRNEDLIVTERYTKPRADAVPVLYLPGEKSNVCEYCGKSFYTGGHMNRHVKRIHFKLRPHICSCCKKAFLTKFELTTHERVHTNETPFKCEVCGKGFREKMAMKKHQKSKHDFVAPNTFQCTACAKEYESEHALLCHAVKRHDGCL